MDKARWMRTIITVVAVSAAVAGAARRPVSAAAAHWTAPAPLTLAIAWSDAPTVAAFRRVVDLYNRSHAGARWVVVPEVPTEKLLTRVTAGRSPDRAMLRRAERVGLNAANGEAVSSKRVVAVEKGTPAAAALRPGDTLVSVDGVSGNPDAMRRQIGSHLCLGSQVNGCPAARPARAKPATEVWARRASSRLSTVETRRRRPSHAHRAHVCRTVVRRHHHRVEVVAIPGNGRLRSGNARLDTGLNLLRRRGPSCHANSVAREHGYTE